ncbi:MAG: NVEALA domain-containing protein [Dysgonamonadaceae bacterium]|jgi:hypothetical protein|nr:NVEALA domain-containing protein [Dysgonamonadaceae bacterium]
MYKKVLYGIAILAIAAVAAWNVNVNSQKEELSDVMLANVEALASETDSASKGTPGTKTTTKYEYDSDGRLIQTITISVSCCASGNDLCSYGPC